MKRRLCCNPDRPRRAIEMRAGLMVLCAAVSVLGCASRATAGESRAPDWMHALVNVALPAHDEKTDAVLLYSEKVLTVQADGKIKHLMREAYKILRPDGRGYGTVRADFDSDSRITALHGWCIPVQGKDYEVKEKDAIEGSPWGDSDGILFSDDHFKVLQIPAADPGNIIGYEIEQEGRPYILQDVWDFQQTVPVREAHYTVQLPPGWSYKVVWLNHPEVPPSLPGSMQWGMSNIPAVKLEERMPPFGALAGRMLVTFFPSEGMGNKSFATWSEMGAWDARLTTGRRDASPEIKQEVAKLTASAPTQLDKMRALARFLQRDIRYVAIQIGIGEWVPHYAANTFVHRYGDCKDKTNLLSSMLHEIGIESYYLSINVGRGIITPDSPPQVQFNHEILAIRLPDGVNDPSLVAIKQHPKFGRLLIFDPTNTLVPFGQIPAYLQGNYGLLDTPDGGGELIELPRMPPTMNGVERTAHLALTPTGVLTGDFQEVRRGDYAYTMRDFLRSADSQADKIRPLEALVADSMATFRLTRTTISNLEQFDQPLVLNYSIVAENYSKTAGNLLLVPPRVIGSKASGILETKEPRANSVVFEGPGGDEGPRRDTDTFEITLPAGYAIDAEDVPPAVAADYSFASYHSKTEVVGNVLRYTRTFEVKELTVPVQQASELKKFYRIIATDERSTAVLHPVAR